MNEETLKLVKQALSIAESSNLKFIVMLWSYIYKQILEM